ncbi:hypothetical protein FHS95_000196 [Sphingomonas naasensis]|nr:hypothetical protein [Sphingomonas naasensis]
MQLLRSLDDLLYAVMTWLVFYPITLWRSIRHPRAMMIYADTELEDRPELQYEDTLSPPLFLLITLILSHLIELSIVGQSALVGDRRGLSSLITDDSTLLIFRLIVFSVFPLIMAVRLLHWKKRRLTRDSLRQPFYSQCYPTGPFALLIGIGGIAMQMHFVAAQLIGLALTILALLWYGSLQTRWFARQLNVSLLRGLWIASVGMVQCVVAMVLLLPLVA